MQTGTVVQVKFFLVMTSLAMGAYFVPPTFNGQYNSDQHNSERTNDQYTNNGHLNDLKQELIDFVKERTERLDIGCLTDSTMLGICEPGTFPLYPGSDISNQDAVNDLMCNSIPLIEGQIVSTTMPVTFSVPFHQTPVIMVGISGVFDILSNNFTVAAENVKENGFDLSIVSTNLLPVFVGVSWMACPQRHASYPTASSTSRETEHPNGRGGSSNVGSEHPNSGSRHPNNKPEYPHSGSVYPISTVEHPSSGIESESTYPRSGSEYPNSEAKYLNSGTGYPSSGSRYPASGILYPFSLSGYPINGYPNGGPGHTYAGFINIGGKYYAR